MKKKYLVKLFILLSLFLLIDCGSSEKTTETPPQKKQDEIITKEIEKPYEGKFDINERFIIPNSNISLDQNDKNVLEDPVIGEFVKLKAGDKYCIILHQFDNDTLRNEKISEVVFAFEISKLETNIKYFPEKFIYYYLSYSPNKSRIDGKTIHGYIVFYRIDQNYAYGNIDFKIEGMKKAFDQEDIEVEVLFKGSFKLPIVNIATIRK